MKILTPNELIQKSKWLSKLLRHNPEDLYMDGNGWITTKDLLNKLEINFSTLKYIVNSDDKQRFSFNDDYSKIRANQGHTLDVDVELEEKTPPTILYHGTASRNIKSILTNGLSKMKRNYVHLSENQDVALEVAKRYCKNDTPYIFKIKAKEMFNDGFKFYQSKNGVWLTNSVEPKYLF